MSDYQNNQYRDMIWEAAGRYGIDPYLLEAIFRQETGHGTSYDWRNYNNPGGIGGMGPGPSRIYHSPQEGFNAMADLIARRYGGANADPSKMGARWVGLKEMGPAAVRDWIRTVQKIRQRLSGAAGYPGRAGQRFLQRRGLMDVPRAEGVEPGSAAYTGFREPSAGRIESPAWEAPEWGRASNITSPYGSGGVGQTSLTPPPGYTGELIGGEFMPGVYTGEIGGPGDPGRYGRNPQPTDSSGYPEPNDYLRNPEPGDSGGRSYEGLGGAYERIIDPSTGNQYFGTDPGGTQGGATELNTNWVTTPWGNVPMALLANPQASTNWASTITGFYPRGPQSGWGTGVPTQRAAGLAGGVLGSFIPIPVLGTLFGAAAGRVIARLMQGGMSQQDAIKAATGGHAPPMPHGTVDIGGGEEPAPTQGQWTPFGGLPPGASELRPWYGEHGGGSMSAYGGAPNFAGQWTTTGPQWGGGSIFSSRLGPGGLVAGGGNAVGVGGNAGYLGPGSIPHSYMTWAPGTTLSEAMGSDQFLHQGGTPYSLDMIKLFREMQARAGIRPGQGSPTRGTPQTRGF